ncbi:adenine deaminase [candidate division WOR-3 bacterium]|nr:adenine deaminase [candidate division WOR-3 bacterium]
MRTYSGNIAFPLEQKICSGTIFVEDGLIQKIVGENKKFENYIIPGFVDSHIHIESSMLLPSEFARAAVSHGTVAAVCDAHEIANVMGTEGLKFMMDDAKKSPFKFFFSAPSCVPATDFETSGACLNVSKIRELFENFPEIKFLGEMMNYPGVIARDPEVMGKIEIAKKYGKKIDGHAPGLMGEDLVKYVSAGITTDHECFMKQEALEKISLGMKIWIREGSAAKNFDELISIAEENFMNCGFCSDDKHPDDLVKGHINKLARRARGKGIGAMKTLKMACVNPVLHYGLNVGLLRIGDSADFLEVEDLVNFKVLKTVIGGDEVYDGQNTYQRTETANVINNFSTKKKTVIDFKLKTENRPLRAIQALDCQLITKSIEAIPFSENGGLVSDPSNDILKISVVNRYENVKPSVAFVKNFGLKKGAVASSVAHDSHNIVVVGVTDEDICGAVNLIVENQGGLSAFCNDEKISKILPLSIAGLMSAEDFITVARKYSELDQLAKNWGSKLKAPYMTLSFMALLVIPEIKLSDKGLFDSVKFEFINQTGKTRNN